ncbi:MAG: hypothetical protein ACD_58C00039G0001 [uncultured bacterium]|nr:MAG: hypothetical protein ACD_58C00039G0001 [uncultured bacterium]
MINQYLPYLGDLYHLNLCPSAHLKVPRGHHGRLYSDNENHWWQLILNQVL